MRMKRTPAPPTPAAPADEWVENVPGGISLSTALRDLWRFRELVGFFALRDVKVRYKQAAFGILWVLIQPIIGMLVLTVVFHQLGHVGTPGVAYVPSTLLGYTAWSYVSTTVVTMTGSFLVNAPLVTKVYFPRLAMPVGAALPGLVDLAGGLVVTGIFVAWYGVVPTIALITLPLWIAALVGMAFSAGTLLGTLNVQFRDVGQVVGLLVQLWFFISPVAYLSSLVHGPLAWVYHLNPMSAILDGLRWSILDGPPPGATALVSLGSGLVLLLCATWYFLHTERRFADII